MVPHMAVGPKTRDGKIELSIILAFRCNFKAVENVQIIQNDMSILVRFTMNYLTESRSDILYFLREFSFPYRV